MGDTATPALPPVAEDVLAQARAYVEDEAASGDPQSLVASLLMVIDLLDPSAGETDR